MTETHTLSHLRHEESYERDIQRPIVSARQSLSEDNTVRVDSTRKISTQTPKILSIAHLTSNLSQSTTLNTRSFTHELSTDSDRRDLQAPPDLDKALALSAFEGVMERIEDWPSRMYYFAAAAASGAGGDKSESLKPIRPRSVPEFNNAIGQARSTMTLSESLRDSEAQRENWFPSVPWDAIDSNALRHRKRSTIKAPTKSAFGSTSRTARPGRCHSCHSTETPQWRRGPEGIRTLCNACGLHFAKLAKRKIVN